MTFGWSAPRDTRWDRRARADVRLGGVDSDGAAKPPPVQVPGAQAPTVRSVTVLVVDDDPMVCYVVARSLRSCGYTVLEADGPLRAIAILEEGSVPDLVVTDVMMPVMNGWHLAERLREGRPDLPVLFMSGYLSDAVFADGVLPEGSPLLTKPFTRAELVAAVDALLPPRLQQAG